MNRLATNSLAALAAIVIAATSFTAVVTVPAPQAVAAVHIPALA
ncbi:hypothetical protein [Aurantiacibacter spongiae]|nr:hypothetical protein [Aurantiacibacter spongiae]